MNFRDRIGKSIEAARARLRRELGTPEQIQQDVRRLASTVREALEIEPPGGPEYDPETGDTLYPPGAVILHDHANDERRERRRKEQR